MSPEAIDPAAVRLAVLAMRNAYGRHWQARSDHDRDAIATTAVDFLSWACSLDGLLRDTTARLGFATEEAAQDAYKAHRDADEEGRVVPGLRHVRDRHMHQVIVSTVLDRAKFFGRFPPQLSSGTVWRPVEELGEPSAKIQKRPDYWPQREAYRLHLQNRPPWVSLRAALRWITREVEGRGVELPPYEEP